jgi:protein tyrosine/serine phosphatase
MKSLRLVRGVPQVMICAALLGGCATAPTSDSYSDQAGVQRVAPIENFHSVDQVGSKAMYRGAQPAADQWSFLKARGVKTVLKLNEYAGFNSSTEQEQLAARANGIRLVEVFMPPEDFPHNVNPFAAPTDAQLAEALAVMENPENWPLYVHCSHGRDRTGLLVALYRIRKNNYCKDKAFAEMKSYGHNGALLGLKKVIYRDGTPKSASCLK